MTNVKFPRKEFEKLLGQKITKELGEKISLFGTPLESINDEEIEIEIFPNRPDVISMQGYIRAFKAFLGKQKKKPEYKLSKPKDNYSVKISPSVKKIRPYTTCAIVTNLSFNDKKIKEIVDMQEKLHNTVGRNRKKVAIGIYPLEKITLPITYEALQPEKIKFIPLEEEREMTGNQILNRHPSGKSYGHLLNELEKYPIFKDAKGEILSMPPIINSHKTGKVTEETKAVFVECSGSHLETLKKTLNIIVTTLADQGGSIHQMNLSYPDKKMITPNLSPEKVKISRDNVNKLLGLTLTEKQVESLLEKMGHEYKKGVVSIPAWRTDILHEVDLIEEIAIAYGYENFTPEIPNVATVAQESENEIFKNKLANLITGLGITEVSTYHLIKKRENELAGIKEKIELVDSKTEYKILRPNLLIPMLRILSENKDNDYPQNLFEIGTIFSKDSSQETGVKETESLCVALSPGNFTKIKQILDYIFKALERDYSLKETSHPCLIEGRTGEIISQDKPVGYFGEVHPKTLKDWGIKMPLAVIEINLNTFFQK